jgi:hypothetical protein
VYTLYNDRIEMHPAVSYSNNTILEQQGVTLNNAIAPFGRSTLVKTVNCEELRIKNFKLHSTNTVLSNVRVYN